MSGNAMGEGRRDGGAHYGIISTSGNTREDKWLIWNRWVMSSGGTHTPD